MDIAEYQKYAIPKIESGKMVNVVRQTVKEAENLRQDQYERQKEVYKPIVEKLEQEIDEISDLREDMKFKPLPAPERLAITDGSQQRQIAHMDAGFTPDDFNVFKKYNLPLPSEVFKESLDDISIVKKIMTDSGKLNQKLGLESGRKSNFFKKDELKGDIALIKKYRSRLGIIEEGTKTLKKGKGLYSKYQQPKRNAYKIKANGQYGSLKIDVPQLVGHLKLIAYKDDENGVPQKVLDRSVDFDTIDLLTKRFNSKKRYSSLSKTVFDRLNQLSEIPIHKTSKKYSRLGQGVIYYNNPRDLLDRLELLGGEIDAGNNAVKVKNEFSEIAHTLNKLNIFSNTDLENLIKEYII